jgi:acetyl-CoA carboxylase biotin carboxyl carrier protein
MPKRIDRDAIRELAELLDETGLTEIEYDTGSVRIRVAREPAPVHAAAPAAVAAPTPAPSAATEPAESAAPAADASHPGAVASPMVGTIYLAPEPGAPNFVAKGDSVAVGQTLMLVEAMKTFNEITAPTAGVVREIRVENGAPVEYGDLLAIID